MVHLADFGLSAKITSEVPCWEGSGAAPAMHTPQATGTWLCFLNPLGAAAPWPQKQEEMQPQAAPGHKPLARSCSPGTQGGSGRALAKPQRSDPLL